MGSIGTTTSSSVDFTNKSVVDLKNSIAYKEGQSFTDLYKQIKKNFNIPDATDKQLDSLRRIFTNIPNYDYYSGDKSPYTIESLDIKPIGGVSSEEAKEYGVRRQAPTLSVYIATTPNVDNAYIRSIDSKYHSILIGPNGGLFTYKNGRRVKMDDYEAFKGSYYH